MSPAEYHWRCDTHLSDRCLEPCRAGWSGSSNPCQMDSVQGPSSLELKRSVKTGVRSKGGKCCMWKRTCHWAPALGRQEGLLVLFGLRMWAWAVRVIKVQSFRTEVECTREWVMTQTLPFLLPHVQALPRPVSPGHERVYQLWVFTYPDFFSRWASLCSFGPSQAPSLRCFSFYWQWKCLYHDIGYQISIFYASRAH